MPPIHSKPISSMDASTGSSSISLAARLPYEIVDLILDLYFTPDSREDLSVICRAWRGSAQRHWFKNITLTKPFNFNRLMSAIEGCRELGSYVRALKLELWRKKGVQDTTPEKVDRLLVMLPNLIELQLNLGNKYYTNWSCLSKLPGLRKLLLHSGKFDKDLKMYRQILSSTPNITSLTLSNDPSGVTALSKKKKVVPIALPALKELSFHSGHLCRLIDKLKLLSDETFDQIECMGIAWPYMEFSPSSPLALLNKIGKNIHTLVLGDIRYVGNQRNDDTAIIRACPNLKTLIFTSAVNLEVIPPSLTRIIYRSASKFSEVDRLSWIFQKPSKRGGGVIQDVDAWENVKTFEIESEVLWIEELEQDQGEPWKNYLRIKWQKVKQSCAEKNIDLVLNGIIIPTSPMI